MCPLALLALCLPLAAPAPKEAPKKDSSLLGEWAVESVIVGGRDTQAPAGALRMTFQADGTLTVRDGKADPRPVGYTADPKKSPAHLDITPPADSGRPTTPGIYKIDGDRLTICLDQLPGAERPREFAAPADTQLSLFVFKRVKKLD